MPKKVRPKLFKRVKMKASTRKVRAKSKAMKSGRMKLKTTLK